jgi:hypothetical protein
MNRHAFVDRILLAAARAASWPRGQYFRDGHEAASFAEHRAAISVELPELRGDAVHELRARTRVGELDCAVRVLQRSASAPLLVWHHGGGEIPFERTIARALAAGTPLSATVVAVRAPHHRSLADLAAGVATLERYVALLAVAVELTERLLRAPEFADAERSAVAGFSLGGFVTNRHHLAYDSADAYLPFMAGTTQADIFLGSYPAARSARQRPDALRGALDFAEEWRGRTHANVFPVLGRFDQLNLPAIHRAAYGDCACEIWQTGHITGANASASIRAFLARHLLAHATRPRAGASR